MCYECGKVFSQDHTLQDHIQMIHKGQPLNIKCDHCDMVFHRREARLRHTNLIHFPDKYVNSLGFCNYELINDNVFQVQV